MTTTAMHDQALAAFTDAGRVVEAVPSVPVERTPITRRVLTKWALGLGKGQRFYYGKLRSDDQHEWTSCGHLAVAQQCFGMANMPGKLMCSSCWLTAAESSEDACDWCGITTAFHPKTTVWPAMYPIGPAVVLLMLCDSHFIEGAMLQSDPGEYVRTTLQNIADTHS